MVWLFIGLLLRLHNLALKPPWTDEFSTLVFGLGQGFRLVPFDQLLDPAMLLSPLRWEQSTTARDTVRVLLTESNHPPLYFALTHWWMEGWQQLGELGREGPLSSYVSLVLARSLSACFGALGIPCIYLVAWWTWRSRCIAHLAAILMALSPFGIYLAQEARHYTLTVIWLLGSLTCLIAALRRIRDRRLIPLQLGVTWISFNGLGLATHYFFALSLLAEMATLAWCWWEWWPELSLPPASSRTQVSFHPSKPQSCSPKGLWPSEKLLIAPSQRQNLGRVGAIALGTTLAGSIWLPYLLATRHGSELIRWVQSPTTLDNWSQPLVHTMASMASMVYLLPIQGVGGSTLALSGLILTLVIGATAWTMAQAIATKRAKTPPRLGVGATARVLDQDTLPLVVIGRVCVSAIAIMAIITYGFGLNISPVFRYHFVYFPAVLLLMAWGLAQLWHQYRWMVGIILAIGLCGAITVSTNLGYQKLHRPDQVVQTVLERSAQPVVMSISHQSHGQTGRLMAVAWLMQGVPNPPGLRSPQFFLDHQPCDRPGAQNCGSPSSDLRQTLDTLHSPYDLWLVNYLGTTNLGQHQCDYQTTRRFDGYKVQHYRCLTH
ncbi:MAG: hypothetical protein AB4042_19580 [Leptolyngbyaceae cyanobacterium]